MRFVLDVVSARPLTQIRGFTATAEMDPKASMAPSRRESDLPRQILMHSSLHRARDQDSELKTSQLAVKPDDSAEAHAIVRAMAISAPQNVAWSYDWGRSNASYWLWATEARREAFARDEKKLLLAATLWRLSSRYLVAFWGASRGIIPSKF